LVAIYGSNTYFIVSLYTNKNNLLHKHYFQLAHGSDMFDHSGKLHHDAFLGEALHLLNTVKYTGHISYSN